jgi:hypothetical protein
MLFYYPSKILYVENYVKLLPMHLIKGTLPPCVVNAYTNSFIPYILASMSCPLYAGGLNAIGFVSDPRP